MQGAVGIPLSCPLHLELFMSVAPNLLINTSLAEFGLRSTFIHNSTSAGSQGRGLGIYPQPHPIYL